MKRNQYLMNQYLTRLIIATAVFVSFSAAGYAQITQTVVALTGNVFNEITRLPETVLMLCFDADGNRVTATRSNVSENGYYYLTGLKPGKKYVLKLRKKGFFKEVYKFEVANTDKYEEISKDFLVKPLEKNIHIPISVTPFERNKSKLRYGSEMFLEDLKNTLANNPKVKFTILSFPDNTKNKKANLKLSEERAKSIMAYFAAHGIDPARMVIKGSAKIDPQNPLPHGKAAKGKRYIGKSYIVVDEF